MTPPLFLLTLLFPTLPIVTAKNRNLNTIYSLSNPASPERFFEDSSITASFDTNVITWTASTPLAVGCGVSILSATDISQYFNTNTSVYEYYWTHVFSSMMDASVPTIDHVITLDVDEVPLVDIDSAGIASGEDVKVAFRMFAFLPYSKGVFVSRTYALDVSTDTLYSLDFNDGYSGSIETYPSPSFMFRSDFMGSKPTAFGMGPCYETIYLLGGSNGGGDDNIIIVGGSDDSENGGACVCQVEDGGLRKNKMQRQLQKQQRELQDDGLVCNENSSPLVDYNLTDGFVMFQMDLDGGENGDDVVAASFYYGVDLDPSLGIDNGAIDYSYNAFYDTDGVQDDSQGDEAVSEHHGIVRANGVAVNPTAEAPLDFLASLDDDIMQTSSLVVGGVWIDSQLSVYYSRETRIPLSEVVDFLPPDTVSNSSSSITNAQESNKNTPHRESSLCPTGSIRNIASQSQEAFVLDVSSSYSSSYLATNAIDGNPSTEWSTAGDGNDAFITIQLPFPSNVVYVDFHTRTMTTSAQISEYQVEAGNRVDDLAVVASSCQVPDATKSYECDLDVGDDTDSNSGGVRNVTLVSFRVIDSSGGNTGAIDLGVYGCSVADEELEAALNGETIVESSSVADVEVLEEEDKTDESTYDLSKSEDENSVVRLAMSNSVKASILFCVVCIVVL